MTITTLPVSRGVPAKRGTPVKVPAPKKAVTPPKTTKPATTNTGAPTSFSDALDGANRDAAIALNKLFTSYGIPTLASTIVGYLKQGYSADTISLLLQDTPEYKKRFAANDARLKAGLPALSPAEYISTENSYRQIMQSAGLPVGFYDQPSDFEKFLAMDVSPTEVKSRVDAVSEALNQAPTDTLNYFKQFYNQGDLIAYALDPTKAAPLIEQRIKAAEAAAVAGQSGLRLDQSAAETIGRTGSTLNQIQSGLGFIAQESPTVTKLGQIYGEDVSQNDLVEEVFNNNGAAAAKRTRLASQERAAFGGSGAQGKNSLSQGSGGQF